MAGPVDLDKAEREARLALDGRFSASRMIKLAYLILDLSAELRRCRRTVEDDERDDAIAVRDAVMCDECDLPYRDRNRYSCWSQGGGHRYNQQELREALGRFA